MEEGKDQQQIITPAFSIFESRHVAYKKLTLQTAAVDQTETVLGSFHVSKSVFVCLSANAQDCSLVVELKGSKVSINDE